MMTFVRKAHKWIALILGIQLTLWMVSGLGMAILPHSKVAGAHRVAAPSAPAPLTELTDSLALPSGPALEDETYQLRLRSLNGRAVFEAATSDGSILHNAETGLSIEVDEALASTMARADYAGPGEVIRTTLLTRTTLEFRDHSAPAWKVDFDDPEGTSIYVSATSGEILERRNHYWRAFDIFWMLHIMDYTDRASFNHPLITTAALIVLWLGISGIILWWDSFRKNDFNLVNRWRSRSQRYALALVDSEGGAVKTAHARHMQTLFAAIEEEGYPLPSSCGGGGTCGLCRVKIGADLPILPADRRQIPAVELAAGYRLACQHQVSSELAVTLPHGLLAAQEIECTLASLTFLTPDMYELRLTLPAPLAFRAGSYVQVEVPPYRSRQEDLNLPPHVQAQWDASGTAIEFGTDETVFRTYSVASAPGELGNEIVLTIRLALAKPEVQDAPVGIGSAYLLSLAAGDKLRIRGPFGDFHVDDASDELVFIGGGAGIAPIRSMIMDELVTHGTTSRITFWYGARTSEHIVYQEEFDALAAKYPNFSWHIVLSELADSDDWHGPRGMVHDVVRDEYLSSHPSLEQCAFYVCGPPLMLEATLQLLEALNIPDARISFDDFGS